MKYSKYYLKYKMLSIEKKTNTAIHSGFTLMELITAIGIITLLAAVLLPAVNKAREKGRKTFCINNLHQIGQALEMYLADNNFRYPSAAQKPSDNPELLAICSILKPYLSGNIEVFRCPSDTGSYYQTEGTSYEWNWFLNGKHYDTAAIYEIPALGGRVKMPVMWDFENFHGKSVKAGGKNILYTDSRVGNLQLED